jgi:hypothetical protein
MAMCKPDLVVGVLKQLGYEVPDAETLTKAVFEAAKKLKVDNGFKPTDCIPLTVVRAPAYKGGVRAKTKRFKTSFSI